eukprot:755537-Hanusia_phi.AAC.3
MADEDWMEPATRKLAVQKLDNMFIQVNILHISLILVYLLLQLYLLGLLNFHPQLSRHPHSPTFSHTSWSFPHQVGHGKWQDYDFKIAEHSFLNNTNNAKRWIIKRSFLLLIIRPAPAPAPAPAFTFRRLISACLPPLPPFISSFLISAQEPSSASQSLWTGSDGAAWTRRRLTARRAGDEQGKGARRDEQETSWEGMWRTGGCGGDELRDGQVNGVFVPGGLLQEPFFSSSYPDARNYG